MLAQSTISDLQIDNDPDWLPIDEVVELTGDHVRNWRRRASFLENRGQAVKHMPRGRQGKRIWWFHRRCDARLDRIPGADVRDERARSSLLDRHPLHRVERAFRRAFWMHEWHKRRNAPRVAGRTQRDISKAVCDEARRVEGDTFKINPRSLQLWFKGYNEVRDGAIVGVEALVDGYKDPDRDASRSPEAVRYFYSLYHAENKLSITECHRFTRAAAAQQGWVWPKSASATRAWIRKTEDRAETCLKRDGFSAWSHKFMPHLKGDHEAVPAGYLYVADHKQCDFFASYRGKHIRPWLTAVQDYRSRMIVGWHLGPAPHTDAILAAMRRAFRDAAIPHVFRIDNGKDFTSKCITGLTKNEHQALKRQYGSEWKSFFDKFKRTGEFEDGDDRAWLGVLPELGVELIFAIPYHAWSKGTLERWFRTFGDQCCRHFATWCGDKPQTKPEALKTILSGAMDRPLKHPGPDEMYVHDPAAIPTLDEARERVGVYIDERYNNQAHTGNGMYNRTPCEVFATAPSVRKAEDEALCFLTSIRGAYTVGPNGVTVTAFGGQTIYGAGGALNKYRGRKVLMAVDFDAPGEAWAIDPATRRLIARLASQQRVHPHINGEVLREAFGETRRLTAAAEKTRRQSARRTRTAVQRANEVAQADLVQRRATGTDDAAARTEGGHRVVPDIVAVRTGVESASKAVQSYRASPLKGGHNGGDNPYANISLDALTFATSGDEDGECVSDNPYANLDLDHSRPWFSEEQDEDES